MSSSNSVSNSRLTLSLPSAIKTYTPSSTLHPEVSLHTSSNEYTSLTLHLIGTTTATIMAKDRFQAGAMANLGSGGSPMLITSIEKVPFLDLEIPLVSSAGASSQVSEKKSMSSSDSNSKGGIYEITLPSSLPGILPTSIKSLDDAAGVSVRYYLEVRGTRKGFLKSNDKLQLDFKVVLPLRPRNALELKDWNSKIHEVPLKFKNELGNNPIRLIAKFSVQPILTCTTPIPFHLELTSDSPQGLSLLNQSTSTPPPLISISLARRVRTEPIKDLGLGKVFDWAGVKLVRGSLEKVVAGGEKGDKGEFGGEGKEEYRGEVVIPDGQCTVEAPGVRIHYVLTCSVRSPSLEKEMILKVNVFLPSADYTTEESNHYFKPPPPMLHYDEEEESGLPSYSA